MTKQAADPGWELYRSFLAVLNEGSLSAAARSLGLTQPTIGRHVDALEQAVGFALFTRSQHGFMPTEAALSLQPYAESLASTTAALMRAASAHGGKDASARGIVRGTVRITASEVVGAEILPSILVRLKRAHPELVVELALSNRVEDLLRREADIAVRMLRPTQEVLVTRRAGVIELGFHAHKDYLAQRGTPKNMDQLMEHTLVGFDKETAFIRNAAKDVAIMRRSHFSLRTDSDLAQLAMIRAGYGIGICQAPLARRHADLVRLFPKQFSMKLETWVTMHEDLRNSARVSATFDALVEGLQEYIAS
ncbi:transcriptional regulator [Herbaspirillum sp. CF444]|uniref:LysR family transcriptional regulator n=1 Tax=Herbaspirillum sp. CF444 TaxID=1144319 RepID=UPI0002725827|nr:LysR family transcriptional regulator [Herbaspirillum sp. CF444]EJL84823.1 transcriptional regulator [Herbaspirillum sp. CF444]